MLWVLVVIGVVAAAVLGVALYWLVDLRDWVRGLSQGIAHDRMLRLQGREADVDAVERLATRLHQVEMATQRIAGGLERAEAERAAKRSRSRPRVVVVRPPRQLVRVRPRQGRWDPATHPHAPPGDGAEGAPAPIFDTHPSPPPAPVPHPWATRSRPGPRMTSPQVAAPSEHAWTEEAVDRGMAHLRALYSAQGMHVTDEELRAHAIQSLNESL